MGEVFVCFFTNTFCFFVLIFIIIVHGLIPKWIVKEIQLVLELIQLDLTLFTVSNHTKAYKPKGDKLTTVIILPRLTHFLIHFIFFLPG